MQRLTGTDKCILTRGHTRCASTPAIPPPPWLPPFPYTTLFRSIPRRNRAPNKLPRPVETAAAKDATLQIIDRKSTRLNSSHVAISYAVFCLKKKIHINFTACLEQLLPLSGFPSPPLPDGSSVDV